MNAGSRAIWVSHDDIPHKVESTEEKFNPAALDTTTSSSSARSIVGPKMTGKVVVEP